MDDEQFGDFTANYYRRPSPERAPEALEHLTSSPRLQAAIPASLASYIFARIADSEPGVIQEYEHLYERSKSQLVLDVIRQTGDQSAANADILRRPIRVPLDLDFLWAEFSLTGHRQAVRRIVEVLEWPDRVRERLQEWLQSKPRFTLFTGPRGQVREALWARASIALDLDSNAVKTIDDLDCLCALEELHFSDERLKSVTAVLPFRLSPEDISHLMVKATAKWALASNSIQHPLVLEVCDEQGKQRQGNAKLALLEVTAFAYMHTQAYEPAAERMREYLALNPSNQGMGQKLLAADSELELNRLLALSRGTASEQAGPQLEADRCRWLAIGAMEKVRTYRSRLTTSRPGQKPGAISWRFEFLKPDRIHVFQRASPAYFGDQENSDELFDEWTTVAGDHYANVGVWFHAAPGSDPETESRKLNQYLLAEKYVALLRSEPPASVAAYEYRGNTFLLLAYHPIPTILLPSFEITSSIRVSESEASLWIERETGLIAKAEVLMTGEAEGEQIRLKSEQAFGGYNSELQIQPPPEPIESISSSKP